MTDSRQGGNDGSLGVDGHRLFGEDILAGCDDSFEVLRAEVGRGGQYNVVEVELEQFAVALEAAEGAGFVDAEGAQRAHKFVWEDIGDGVDAYLVPSDLSRFDGVLCCTVTTPTTANDTNFEVVWPSGKRVGNREGERGQSGAGSGGVTHEAASRQTVSRDASGWVFHDVFPPKEHGGRRFFVPLGERGLPKV